MRSNRDSRPLPTSKPAFSWSDLAQKLPAAEEHNPPPAVEGSHRDLPPPRCGVRPELSPELPENPTSWQPRSTGLMAIAQPRLFWKRGRYF